MIAPAGTAAVIIPAFNEAASIGHVVRAVCQQAGVTAVIVVDDGSGDDTARRVRELVAEYPQIQLLTHPINRGKGFALATGIAQALASGAAWVVTFDADNQHDAADIPRLLRAAERTAPQSPFPLIIAVRQRADGNQSPPLRRFANHFADFWVSWACGQAITDTQSGLRLYSAALLQQLPTKPQCNQGFRYETELLIDAVTAGAAVYRVDVANRYQHAARPSHYRPWHDTWSITRLVAIRLLRRGLYPLGLMRVLQAGVLQLIRRRGRGNDL
ncbi:glycosyltransferase family 2 protein [Rhodoferax sp. 4810]|uniref:Glycosyltransferase family 2 protein n=1 Tax=Thiospirillum jenense TaxID=1653858 RepID=A0A839HCE9_9GAMM|nr:glycosyltransferase family 2 protein [Thiospirillum jenense]MBB1074807.1 glycosyltransferase family 2 protein [Rhodoferax jenense]MBB1126645.1 glycosyltransferase family 2 protein [Thiospirillum jenense]